MRYSRSLFRSSVAASHVFDRVEVAAQHCCPLHNAPKRVKVVNRAKLLKVLYPQPVNGTWAQPLISQQQSQHFKMTTLVRGASVPPCVTAVLNPQGSNSAVPHQELKKELCEGMPSQRSVAEDLHHVPTVSDESPHVLNADPFPGEVQVRGVFLSVDPCFCLGSVDRMNPNVQLTIESTGAASEKNDEKAPVPSHPLVSRVRYSCFLESSKGFKVEALVRCQVGWVSRRTTFRTLPEQIYLGRGFDVSLPCLFHFTAVEILEEDGATPTGSYLCLSGTPILGLSVGATRIQRGVLTLNPTKPIEPSVDSQQFYFHRRVHVRQFVLLLTKMCAYASCFILTWSPLKALHVL